MNKKHDARTPTYLALAGIWTVALVTALFFVGDVDPDAMSLLILPLVLVSAVITSLAARRRPPAFRWAVLIAHGTAFILFWGIGGVGFLGSDNQHPADLLYGVVPAVGFIGGLIGRFRSGGMVRVMIATAVAQLLVPLIALTAGILHPPVDSSTFEFLRVFIFNGGFAALFLGSALLFRRAAESPPEPRELAAAHV